MIQIMHTHRLYLWRAHLLAAILTGLLAGSQITHAVGPVSHPRGLLWEISNNTGKPSYLFGTFHSADPRITRLPPVLERVFRQTSSFSMEVIFNGDGFVQMAEAMYLPQGKRLQDILGESLYAETRKIMEKAGLDTDDLQHKKPWAVIMELGAPKEGIGIFLDLKLQMMAIRQKKPTFALETMAEQIAVFNQFDMDDQVALLRESLKFQDESSAQMRELVAAYMARDLKQLAAISDRYQAKSGPVYHRLMIRMLNDRNKLMLKRMMPRLKEGNAFIAVGALHLPGKEGLLSLLEAAGYSVRPLY